MAIVAKSQKRQNTALETSGILLVEETDEYGKTISPASGSSVSATLDALTITYSYDLFNRLTESKSGKKTTSFTYTADDYRLSKTDATGTIFYFYEGDKVEFEEDANSAVTAVNHVGTSTYARTIFEEGAETTFYYRFNAYGDVTALTGTDGSLIAKYEYDAFGNLTSQPDTKVNNSITYRGYEYDAETGLYYLNARYYDSTTARFLTEDTYRGEKNDPLSLNLYTYCKNNPLKYTDPTGHMYYSKQFGYLLDGVIESTIDDVKGLASAPKDIIELIWDIVTGKIKTKDLVEAGLDSIVDEINYFKDNAYILLPATAASDDDVKEFGRHIGHFVSDLAISYVGGAVASKLVKVLNKTTTGKKILKKLSGLNKVINKTDDIDDLARVIDDTGDVVKKADKAGDTAKAVDKISDSTKVVNNSDLDFDNWLNKGNADNKVYFGIDADGQANYTGITRQSKDARLYQHNKNGKKFSDLEIQYDDLTRNQARSLEQYFIENGPNILNKINSISPKNRNYKKAMKWAEEFMKGH